MAGNRLLSDLECALQEDFATINDPGTSGSTIKFEQLGYGVCEVVTTTAETRALDTASKYGKGTLLLVTLKTAGGALTITNVTPDSVVLNEAGQGALFVVTRAGSTYEWRSLNQFPGITNSISINIKDAPYNAVGDGIADDSAVIQAAATAAKAAGALLTASAGTYLIASNVTMREQAVDFSLATVLVSGTTTKLIIGGNANHANNPAQKFYKVQRTPSVNSNPTCQVLGTSSQDITVEYCDYLQVYANADSGGSPTTDSNISYSNFHLHKCDRLDLTNNAGSDNVTQYINENNFYLRRTKNFVMSGTYSHNNNYIYGGAFEVSGATIDFQSGSSNVMFGQRCEATTPTPVTVNFASGTHSNQVLVSYSSDVAANYRDTQPAVVTDSGVGNICIRSAWQSQNKIPIVIVNDRTCQTFTNATGTGRANFTSLRGVDVQRNNADNFKRAANATVFDSPLIPVSRGDAILFMADANNFRCIVKVYNSSRVQLLDADGISTMLNTKSGLSYNSGTSRWVSQADMGVTGTFAIVLSSSVAFVKFDVNGAGTLAVPFREFALHKATYSVTPLPWADSTMQAPRNPAATASPTVGYAAEIGMKVSNTAGGWFTATTAVDTTVATTVSSGTTLVVTTATGATGFGSMASGDVIGVALDDGTTLWTTINGAPSGTTITLTASIPSTATAGNRVTTNKWVAT